MNTPPPQLRDAGKGVHRRQAKAREPVPVREPVPDVQWRWGGETLRRQIRDDEREAARLGR